ncbi:MAG: hypothetical protein VW338_03460 [Rhodospirillaceae bacterium]
MDATDDYLAAALPTGTRVLGVRLPVYKFGHAVWLRRLKSQFTESSAKHLTHGDLLLALGILRREDPADCPRRLQAWIRWKTWLTRRLSHDTWHAEKVRLLSWLLRQEAMPRCSIPEDSKGKSGAPWLLRMKTTLMRELNLTDRQIELRPMREAIWEHAVILEAGGLIQIHTKEDEEILELARQREAEKQRKEPVHARQG